MARCLVVGLGSIGSRHLRVLAELGHEVASVSRRGEGRYAAIGAAVSAFAPDYVVIATETGAHEAGLAELASANFTGIVLVEKPLFAAPGRVPANRFAGIAVGYNLRFHPLVARFRERIAGRAFTSVSAHVGQHLSEWRPGRDMAATASATRAAGGGVLRDLSHELDLVQWLFGRWQQVTANGGNSGGLGIEAEDHMSLLLAVERCPDVAVHLNYLDRPAERTLRAASAETTIALDLIRGTISVDENTETVDVGRDDSYRAMHQSVLAGENRACSLDEGLEVVALIAAAEEAASRRSWVAR